MSEKEAAVDEVGAVTSGEITSSEITIRRAPRFGAFLAIGGLLGALATLILTSFFEPDPAVGFLGSLGYFLIFGIPAGLAVGGVAAIIADAVSRRRARTGTADHTVVEPAETTEDDA